MIKQPLVARWRDVEPPPAADAAPPTKRATWLSHAGTSTGASYEPAAEEHMLSPALIKLESMLRDRATLTWCHGAMVPCHRVGRRPAHRHEASQGPGHGQAVGMTQAEVLRALSALTAAGCSGSTSG